MRGDRSTHAATAAGLVLVASWLGCSTDTAEDAADTTFPEAPLATVTSSQGGLSLAVRTAPQQPPKRGLVSVEIVATNSAGAAVEDLDLTAVPWMPDMGHGASTKPTIEARGAGHYVVSRVAFFMPGRWDLRLTMGGPVNDSATLAFRIP